MSEYKNCQFYDQLITRNTASDSWIHQRTGREECSMKVATLKREAAGVPDTRKFIDKWNSRTMSESKASVTGEEVEPVTVWEPNPNCVGMMEKATPNAATHRHYVKLNDYEIVLRSLAEARKETRRLTMSERIGENLSVHPVPGGEVELPPLVITEEDKHEAAIRDDDDDRSPTIPHVVMLSIVVRRERQLMEALRSLSEARKEIERLTEHETWLLGRMNNQVNLKLKVVSERNQLRQRVDIYKELCRQILEADRSIDPDTEEETTLERIQYLVRKTQAECARVSGPTGNLGDGRKAGGEVAAMKVFDEEMEDYAYPNCGGNGFQCQCTEKELAELEPETAAPESSVSERSAG